MISVHLSAVFTDTCLSYLKAYFLWHRPFRGQRWKGAWGRRRDLIILDRRENSLCLLVLFLLQIKKKSQIVEKGNVVLLNQYIFLWPDRSQCMLFNKTTHVFKDMFYLNLISSFWTPLLLSKQRLGDGFDDLGEIC